MRQLTVFFFLLPFIVEGQHSQIADSPGVDSIAAFYFANQGETLAIHNGRVFLGYPGIVGDAFYPSTAFQKGSILFDGTWYHDVSIMYDIYQDDVILLHPGSTPIRLFSGRIAQFSFDGLNFVRLNADKDHVLKPGFYQHLVEGNATILVHRSKKIEENIVDMRVERKFVSATRYFILRDGAYHPIHRQKFLFDILKVNRQAIIKHLKSQGIRYKDDQEKAIIAIAQYYNQLRK
ncbi:hypothetical protein [Terrimonas alba]|uniref:hypothetical protein n=1 Tax=Terrimonas alba TaxID=3349636 RepID=UPI0035F486E8